MFPERFIIAWFFPLSGYYQNPTTSPILRSTDKRNQFLMGFSFGVSVKIEARIWG
jgi:hypothetical protein